MKIDISRAALLILHCQNDIVDAEGQFKYSGAYAQVEESGLLNKIKVLRDAAHVANLQVFYVNNEFRKGFPELGKKTLPILEGVRENNSTLEGSWGIKNPDIIEPSQQDIVIINTNTSAFSYTNLDQILRAKEIRQLILVGCVSNFVVDSTARYGSELGYEIIVPHDGSVSFSKEMHEFEIKFNLPKFAEITTLEEIHKQLK